MISVLFKNNDTYLRLAYKFYMYIYIYLYIYMYVCMYVAGFSIK